MGAAQEWQSRASFPFLAVGTDPGLAPTASLVCEENSIYGLILRTGGVWEGLLWSGQAGSDSKLSGQEQLLCGVEGWVTECCSEQDVCGVEGQAGSGVLQAPDCSEDWGRPGGWVESQVEEVIGIQVGKRQRGEGLF